MIQRSILPYCDVAFKKLHPHSADDRHKHDRSQRNICHDIADERDMHEVCGTSLMSLNLSQIELEGRGTSVLSWT